MIEQLISSLFQNNQPRQPPQNRPTAPSAPLPSAFPYPELQTNLPPSLPEPPDTWVSANVSPRASTRRPFAPFEGLSREELESGIPGFPVFDSSNVIQDIIRDSSMDGSPPPVIYDPITEYPEPQNDMETTAAMVDIENRMAQSRALDASEVPNRHSHPPSPSLFYSSSLGDDVIGSEIESGLPSLADSDSDGARPEHDVSVLSHPLPPSNPSAPSLPDPPVEVTDKTPSSVLTSEESTSPVPYAPSDEPLPQPSLVETASLPASTPDSLLVPPSLPSPPSSLPSTPLPPLSPPLLPSITQQVDNAETNMEEDKKEVCLEECGDAQEEASTKDSKCDVEGDNKEEKQAENIETVAEEEEENKEEEDSVKEEEVSRSLKGRMEHSIPEDGLAEAETMNYSDFEADDEDNTELFELTDLEDGEMETTIREERREEREEHVDNDFDSLPDLTDYETDPDGHVDYDEHGHKVTPDGVNMQVPSSEHDDLYPPSLVTESEAGSMTMEDDDSGGRGL